MKLHWIIPALFLSLHGYSQKLGFREFIIDSPLKAGLISQYAMLPDTSEKNTWFIDGASQKLSCYGEPVDTLWLRTDSTKAIKEIIVKTKTLKLGDYRAYNFEWSLLVDRLGYDYGPSRAGEARFKKTLVAVWLPQTHVWVYASMKKVYPWQKEEQRYMLIHWQRRVKQDVRIEI